MRYATRLETERRRARRSGARALLVVASLLFGAAGPGHSGPTALPGLVSLWSAEGDGDDSVDGNHGVVGSGVSYVSGVQGGAFLFDGSLTSEVVIPDAPNLNPTSEITISAWIQPEPASVVQDQVPIVLKSYTSQADPYYQYGLTWINLPDPPRPEAMPEAIKYYLTVEGVTHSVLVLDTGIAGRWAHVAGTFDGHEMRLYIDGELVGSTAVAGSISTYATEVMLGRYRNLPNYRYQGRIDEVAIYDRALSEGEVRALGDYAPPEIQAISASPDTLWPANRKMVAVTVGVTAADDAGGPVACRIVSVSSDEPAGEKPDWEITGDLTVDLRAERKGSGDGRTYTLAVECEDEAGNRSTGTVTVVVPHDQGDGG